MPYRNANRYGNTPARSQHNRWRRARTALLSTTLAAWIALAPTAGPASAAVVTFDTDAIGFALSITNGNSSFFSNILPGDVTVSATNVVIYEFDDDVVIEDDSIRVVGRRPLIIRSNQNLTFRRSSVNVAGGVAGGGKGGDNTTTGMGAGGAGGVAGGGKGGDNTTTGMGAGGAGGRGGTGGSGGDGRPGGGPGSGANGGSGSTGTSGLAGSLGAGGAQGEPGVALTRGGAGGVMTGGTPALNNRGFGGDGGPRVDVINQAGEDGRPGERGGHAADGRNGGRGVDGAGGVNKGLFPGFLTGGSGGGAGSGGQGGQGGGGGGGGGGGATGTGALGFFVVGAGDGGKGGNGSTGGTGGRGGNGGDGGGVFSLEANGRLILDGAFAFAAGENGENGSAGGENLFDGGPGRSGQSGSTQGGVSGGRGGNGGDGGFGGRGGDGGRGGGGAGGTVNVSGSIVEMFFSNIEASGGNDAEDGRFVVDSNTNVREISNFINARREDRSGPTARNDLIRGEVFTPYLPDLIGGVDLFGLLEDFDATSSIFAPLFADATDNSKAALTRIGDTTSVFGADFTGFDLLLLANLTDELLRDVKLGVDPESAGTGFQTALSSGPNLLGLSVYATLIPQNGTTFSASFAGASLLDVELAAGETRFLDVASVSQIPLPAPLVLLLSALGLLGVASRRRRS